MLHDVKDGKITRDEYTVLYQALLESRKEKLSRILASIPDGAVFCCYCDIQKPGGFCHRQLAGAFIAGEFGYVVEFE